MVVKSSLASSISILRAAVARDGDKSHPAQGGKRSQTLQQFVAIHLGKANVDQCNIWAERLYSLKGVRGRFSRFHFMTIQTQELGEALGRVLIVIVPGRRALGRPRRNAGRRSGQHDL